MDCGLCAFNRALDARGVSEAPLQKRLGAADFPAADPDRPCSAAELPAPPAPTPQGPGVFGAVAGGNKAAAKQVQAAAAAPAAPAAAAAAAGNAAGGKAAAAAAPAAAAGPEHDSDATAPADPNYVSSGSYATSGDSTEAGDEVQSPVVQSVVAAAAAEVDSPARHLSGVCWARWPGSCCTALSKMPLVCGDCCSGDAGVT